MIRCKRLRFFIGEVHERIGYAWLAGNVLVGLLMHPRSSLVLVVVPWLDWKLDPVVGLSNTV